MQGSFWRGVAREEELPRLKNIWGLVENLRGIEFKKARVGGMKNRTLMSR